MIDIRTISSAARPMGLPPVKHENPVSSFCFHKKRKPAKPALHFLLGKYLAIQDQEDIDISSAVMLKKPSENRKISRPYSYKSKSKLAARCSQT